MNNENTLELDEYMDKMYEDINKMDSSKTDFSEIKLQIRKLKEAKTLEEIMSTTKEATQLIEVSELLISDKFVMFEIVEALSILEITRLNIHVKEKSTAVCQ